MLTAPYPLSVLILVTCVIAAPPVVVAAGDRRPVKRGLARRDVGGKAVPIRHRGAAPAALTAALPRAPPPANHARVCWHDRSGTRPGHQQGGDRMSTTARPLRNGVDTEQLFGTLDAIKADPSIARFQFRATEPLDRRCAQPHDDSRLLCRQPGGHIPRRGVRDRRGRAGDPAGRRHRAQTPPSTCCTRSPRA